MLRQALFVGYNPTALIGDVLHIPFVWRIGSDAETIPLFYVSMRVETRETIGTHTGIQQTLKAISSAFQRRVLVWGAHASSVLFAAFCRELLYILRADRSARCRTSTQDGCVPRFNVQ